MSGDLMIRRWASASLGVLLLSVYLGACNEGSVAPVMPRESTANSGTRHAQPSYRRMAHRFSVIGRRQQTPSLALMRLLERTSGFPQNVVARGVFQTVGKPKARVWVMIARSGICMAQLRRTAATCDVPRRVYRLGIAVGSFKAPKEAHGLPTSFVVTGIAPDNKKFVTVLVGKRHRRLPINHNFYALASAAPIKVLGLGP